MKRIAILVLVIVTVAAMSSCGKIGGGGAAQSDGGGTTSGDEGNIDLTDEANEMISDAIEDNAFSEAAAAQAIKNVGGIDEKDILPDWAYTIDESTMANYGDRSHGSLYFIAEDGDMSDDEYYAWAKKVYDATAKISPIGNVYGFEGNSETPDAPLSFEEAMGIGSDAWIILAGWSYKYNDQYVHVYVDREMDSEAMDEANANITSMDDYKTIYKGATVDIAQGMQMSWDDAMAYLEEHSDEIEAALEDYAD